MGFIGRTWCANQGDISQDAITTKFNKIADSVSDCDGSFLWCWVINPIRLALIGAMQELCDSAACSAKADKDNWMSVILGYLVTPVCWLLSKEDLFTGVVIVGALLYFLAPIISVGIMLAR
jgi:hypothetical protein